jgi:hypothetical protein
MAEEWLMVVDGAGKVEKMEVKGGDGLSCLKATQKLEKLLGNVTKRQMKAESHKTQNVAEKLKVGK